jgi:hypothetical protein
MQGGSGHHPELLDASALVGHLVPEGSVHRFLAEHRQRLFPDRMFEDLFASKRGRPSVPADVIATVMVLQSLEGRSDREAIEALRTDLRWKVAAGLSLDDEGFHPTVLTLWRNKLRASDTPERIFDAVRAVIAETGVLGGKTRRAGLDVARRRCRHAGHRHPARVDDPPGPQDRARCRGGHRQRP